MSGASFRRCYFKAGDGGLASKSTEGSRVRASPPSPVYSALRWERLSRPRLAPGPAAWSQGSLWPQVGLGTLLPKRTELRRGDWVRPHHSQGGLEEGSGVRAGVAAAPRSPEPSLSYPVMEVSGRPGVRARCYLLPLRASGRSGFQAQLLRGIHLGPPPLCKRPTPSGN